MERGRPSFPARCDPDIPLPPDCVSDTHRRYRDDTVRHRDDTVSYMTQFVSYMTQRWHSQ